MLELPRGSLRTRGRQRGDQLALGPSGGYGARSDFVARALAPPSPESLTTRLSRVPFFTVEGMIHVEMSFFFPSMRSCRWSALVLPVAWRRQILR